MNNTGQFKISEGRYVLRSFWASRSLQYESIYIAFLAAPKFTTWHFIQLSRAELSEHHSCSEYPVMACLSEKVA